MQIERRISGYSLIEVLVAMMVLAMSLTVLFRIFSGGLRNVEVAAEYSRAVIIAETKLAEAGIAADLAPGESFGMEHGRFHWRRTVEDYRPFDSIDSDSSPIAAYQVTIAIEWEHRGRMREISLSTIRLNRGGAT